MCGEMGYVQRAAHARIVGMGRQYGMWMRAAATRANAAMYCRYWVAHLRATSTVGSQSGALSHRHSSTLAALESVCMSVRMMLGWGGGCSCYSTSIIESAITAMHLCHRHD